MQGHQHGVGGAVQPHPHARPQHQHARDHDDRIARQPQQGQRQGEDDARRRQHLAPAASVDPAPAERAENRRDQKCARQGAEHHPRRRPHARRQGLGQHAEQIVAGGEGDDHPQAQHGNDQTGNGDARHARCVRGFALAAKATYRTPDVRKPHNRWRAAFAERPARLRGDGAHRQRDPRGG